MHLTSRTDYSLRVLIYLALQPGPGQATVQEVATRYGISSNHVAKVAQKLVQLGYVVSHRGRGGGLAWHVHRKRSTSARWFAGPSRSNCSSASAPTRAVPSTPPAA